jgi:hypothetical protein
MTKLESIHGIRGLEKVNLKMGKQKLGENILKRQYIMR